MSVDVSTASDLTVTTSIEGQAILGGTAQLRCGYSLEARQFSSVTWYKVPPSSDSKIATGTWQGKIENTNQEKYGLTYDNTSQSNLSISNIELVDGGGYKCRVIAADAPGDGWSWNQVNVTVLSMELPNSFNSESFLSENIHSHLSKIHNAK